MLSINIEFESRLYDLNSALIKIKCIISIIIIVLLVLLLLNSRGVSSRRKQIVIRLQMRCYQVKTICGLLAPKRHAGQLDFYNHNSNLKFGPVYILYTQYKAHLALVSTQRTIVGFSVRPSRNLDTINC